MKYVVLIPDGLADRPVKELGDKTPVEVARTPALDSLAISGMMGLVRTIPEGFAPGSDVGNLSLFGYDPRQCFTGRAPLEAANLGIPLGDGDVVFRCNLVSIDDGKMADFTAGHITTRDATSYIDLLNEKLGREGLRFHRGVSYRHLMTLNLTHVGDVSGAEMESLQCTPPHDISGQEMDSYLPKGNGQKFIRDLMQKSEELFRNYRNALPGGEESGTIPTQIWLWGQGKRPSMQTFREMHGVEGAVVSAVDLVKGIGRIAGLDPLQVPGATGYIDTNYEGKVKASLEALERQDVVFLHVEAIDETSHEGITEKKIQAIEAFDERIAGPVLAGLQKYSEYRVLMSPDHGTALDIRTHISDPVPFVISGTAVAPNGQTSYSETSGKESGILVEDGFRLVHKMISEPILEADSDWSRTGPPSE